MPTTVRPVAHREPASCDDAGFTLVEVVVALGLVLVVMTATAAFFVRSLHSTDGSQQRQAAVALADQPGLPKRRWAPVPPALLRGTW